tara:strand:- start:629 stop:1513 length:885 start_codon:yes stop_codon:yes gene_type:complete
VTKYLIILSGIPRGGHKTWASLVRNVQKPLNADIALLYGDKFKISKYLRNQSRFDWQFKEPENWKDFYQERFQDESVLDFIKKGSKYGMAGGIDDFDGSGAIVQGFRMIVYENYLDELLKYDYIIYTRFDQYYVSTHPHFKGDKLWIPKGEDYFGICDRHVIFPSKYSKKFFGVHKYLGNPETHKNTDYEISTERVYLDSLIHNEIDKHIERIDRFQFTSAIESDPTRWRKAKYKIYLSGGLLMKYPDEFIDSVYNQFKLQGVKYIFTHPIISLNYFYLQLRRYIGKQKKIYSD